jgi:hypothetical protein
MDAHNMHKQTMDTGQIEITKAQLRWAKQEGHDGPEILTCIKASRAGPILTQGLLFKQTKNGRHPFEDVSW